MDAKPWDASIDYSFDEARKIITADTDLVVKEISLLGEGWDNKAFLINREWVFRFVRREMGLEFTRCELIGLPLLPAKMSLGIPRIVYRGLYRQKWLWMGYPLLPGKPIYETGLADAQRVLGATKIAKFLKELHSENPQHYLDAGLPGDWCGHMNLEKRIPRARVKIKLLSQLGILEDGKKFSALAERVASLDTTKDRVVVAHGDFKATHILFDQSEPVSVIDWGDLHVGHPATDLSVAFTLFPKEGRDCFFAEYGEVKEDLFILAQFRAMFHTFAILEYAHETAQKDLFEEALRALRWTFD